MGRPCTNAALYFSMLHLMTSCPKCRKPAHRAHTCGKVSGRGSKRALQVPEPLTQEEEHQQPGANLPVPLTAEEEKDKLPGVNAPVDLTHEEANQQLGEENLEPMTKSDLELFESPVISPFDEPVLEEAPPTPLSVLQQEQKPLPLLNGISLRKGRFVTGERRRRIKGKLLD